MLIFFNWFFSQHTDPAAVSATAGSKGKIASLVDTLNHSQLLGVLRGELLTKHQEHSDSVQDTVLALTGELTRLKAQVALHTEIGRDEPSTNSISSAYTGGRGSTNYSLCHKTLSGRADLPSYLNSVGLVGQAVEIGVRRGHFSSHMLKNWRGKTLHLVDPWEHQESTQYHDVSNMPQDTHNENLEHVKAMLDEEAPGRYEIHRGYSVEIAKTFTDNTLDFVYIDARHDYTGVLEDLVAWYPKLKDGGILAGHDFIPDQIKPVEGDFGVQKAVNEFARLKSREVQSISSKALNGGRAEPQRVDGGWTTFYFFK